MEINLERGDLLQLDPISNKGTVKLLAPGKKNKQKLVTGDDSGTLACYEFKKGEPQPVFSSRPFEGPITNVALGGAVQKKDKIFASHSQRIVGYTKKGKEFFKLTSSLTETILNIIVDDTKIFTGCEYIYNLYDNGQDTAFYMCRHQINSILVEYITSDHNADVLLGCQDSCIRLIQGSQLIREIPVLSPVTALATIPTSSSPSPSPSHSSSTSILYGTESGLLGTYDMTKSTQRSLWALHDGNEKSPINCICVHDLLREGAESMLIGRNDGRIEVYVSNAEQIGESNDPLKVFSREVGESIRSVDCGAVNNADNNEVVIASYSGKILSYTTEQVLKRASDDKQGRSTHSVNTENRMRSLMSEIDAIQLKMEKDKAAYRKTQGGQPSIPPPPDFAVNSTFTLDADLAAYILTVEIQSPIDLLVLRSPIPLDLVESNLQSGSIVVSVVPPAMIAVQAAAQAQAQGNGTGTKTTVGGGGATNNKFVATYRCQNKERRITITMRTTEGEAGDMQVVVVAASAPKAAKVISFSLRPLSLHAKVHELTPEELARPKSVIRFTGNMLLGTAHEWVQSILPDVPPHLAENDTECTFYFRNSFTGSTACVEYRRNEIIFQSDSPSAVAIAKEMISRLATARRIQLEEDLTAKEESVECFLSLIRGKLEHLLSLARKVDIIEAIQEITQQSGDDGSWLSPEYAAILKSQDLIKQEFKDRARALEYLTGIVTDLFVDWHRLRGVEVRHRIPQLQQVILSNDFNALVQQFLKSGK